MANDVMIRAEGLGKKYTIGHLADRERYLALRDVMARGAKSLWRKTADMARGRAIVTGDTLEEFWALRDVSFEVKRGEVLGVIGRNGAGKTTLLKILSRITEPSEGRVTIRGRVASLLEVGTGFHPELTGRENIYLNGAILGMTRGEIRQKFDEIVAFAEVEKFLDTQVKRYSSGMYLRLAFAVAAHLEPEILVLDEVLAVGDAEFQNKCLGKMSEVAGGGRTALFVSHNMSAIETLCPRTIHLASGSVVGSGETTKIVAAYLSEHRGRTRTVHLQQRKLHEGLILERLCMSSSYIRSGDSVDIRIEFKAEASGQLYECAVLFYSTKGQRIATVDTRESGLLPFRYEDGKFSLIVQISALPLVEGDFTIGLFLASSEYTGDILELADVTVEAPRSRPGYRGYVPYPAEVTGFIVLNASTSLVPDHGIASPIQPLPTL
jgi:lipopolysaccharide transport system ATP-binding protein